MNGQGCWRRCLGKCPSHARLNLSSNWSGDEGAVRLASCWGNAHRLLVWIFMEVGSRIGVEGVVVGSAAPTAVAAVTARTAWQTRKQCWSSAGRRSCSSRSAALPSLMAVDRKTGLVLAKAADALQWSFMSQPADFRWSHCQSAHRSRGFRV